MEASRRIYITYLVTQVASASLKVETKSWRNNSVVIKHDNHDSCAASGTYFARRTAIHIGEVSAQGLRKVCQVEWGKMH